MNPDKLESLTLCRLCDEIVDVTTMVQLMPCLHIFCKTCISTYKKVHSVCPQLHCYSPVSPNEEHTWNPCDNKLCAHRFGAQCDTYNLSLCKHSICSHCFNEAVRKKRQCPVYKCGMAIDEDDGEFCEGPCNQSRESDKLVTMKCCRRKICRQCLLQMYGEAATKTEEQKRCPPDKCTGRSAAKKSANEEVPLCSKIHECENEALRDFPSKDECEHSVCMDCLRQMIKECSPLGQFPVCPISECRVFYRCETVAALKTIFPEYSKYFSDMEVDFHLGFEGIRDETKEVLCYQSISSREKSAAGELPSLLIRCLRNDEEEEQQVEVPRDIRLGEFIREARLKLNVLDADRIYGYYIEREGGRIEETVSVSPANRDDFITKISSFRSSATLSRVQFVVDMSGIVRPKH